MQRASRRQDLYRTYAVSARHRQPLVAFIVDALHGLGCRILFASPPSEAPFRITFETSDGERIGIVAYAFHADRRVTKDSRSGEYRFQATYGPKHTRLREFWQDPYGLYTTLLLGISPQLGIFVGADPVAHSTMSLPPVIKFTDDQVSEIRRTGWTQWEQERHEDDDSPVDVLVGGRPESFLRYILFEREALREDQGHRHLLAEQFAHVR